MLAIQAHNQMEQCKIKTVAFPTMGTCFGGVAFTEAARQMAAAWRHYLEPPHRVNWDVATDRHKAISYDGLRQVAR